MGKNLGPHKMIIKFDYSENLKYVTQNASQPFHFINSKFIVFPVIYYYKEENVLKEQSCVFYQIVLNTTQLQFIRHKRYC